MARERLADSSAGVESPTGVEKNTRGGKYIEFGGAKLPRIDETAIGRATNTLTLLSITTGFESL